MSHGSVFGKSIQSHPGNKPICLNMREGTEGEIIFRCEFLTETHRLQGEKLELMGGNYKEPSIRQFWDSIGYLK